MFGELSLPGAAREVMAWGGGWDMLRRLEEGQRKDYLTTYWDPEVVPL